MLSPLTPIEAYRVRSVWEISGSVGARAKKSAAPAKSHNRLREIRELRGKTQAEIAAALGLRQTSYRRYESGERQVKLHQLPGFAKVLSCRVAELLPVEHALNASQVQLLDVFDCMSADQQRRLQRLAVALAAEDNTRGAGAA